MFYGAGDFRIWNFFLEQSANKAVMFEKLKIMYNFCVQPQCRHRVFVDYFGQNYQQASCAACDYCLGEVDTVTDPLGISRAILSCVDKLCYGDGRSFGAGYISNVLKGNITEQITGWRHEQMPFFGAMAQESIFFIRYMIEQLAGQGFLARGGEFSTLFVTDSGRQVLTGELVPVLAKPLVAKKKKEISQRQRKSREDDWSGIDENLFEILRKKRSELAEKQGVPAYIIFGDRSLKDMSIKKPLTPQAFAAVFGVGEHKLKLYAKPFIQAVKQYCESGRLAQQ
jgi:ATP-dependent DNA helicase RecQ